MTADGKRLIIEPLRPGRKRRIVDAAKRAMDAHENTFRRLAGLLPALVFPRSYWGLKKKGDRGRRLVGQVGNLRRVEQPACPSLQKRFVQRRLPIGRRIPSCPTTESRTSAELSGKCDRAIGPSGQPVVEIAGIRSDRRIACPTTKCQQFATLAPQVWFSEHSRRAAPANTGPIAARSR